MGCLGLDNFSTLQMNRYVLHHARAQLKVPGWSLVWNALLTKTLPMFLLRLNEISGGCKKMLRPLCTNTFWWIDFSALIAGPDFGLCTSVCFHSVLPVWGLEWCGCNGSHLLLGEGICYPVRKQNGETCFSNLVIWVMNYLTTYWLIDLYSVHCLVWILANTMYTEMYPGSWPFTLHVNLSVY